jgi:hypothetical protein
MSEAKEGDVRVFWFPQVPCAAFHVNVPTLADALRMLDTLGDYDLFLEANRIRGDYSNAGGIEVFEDGEWCEVEEEEVRERIAPESIA